jgi:septal ring factor EnvC (AmiA/AmiB activator)
MKEQRQVLCILVGAAFALALSVAGGQERPADSAARRVDDRIRALEREAIELAGQSRTLVGELRMLEIQRDLRIEESRSAEAEATEARQALQQTSQRMAALEKQRADQLPNLKAQLVDVYKNGRGGYARLLFDVNGLRDFARATRVVTAMATLNERRIEEHRRTLEALARERTALAQRTRELDARESAVQQARGAALRAVADHATLIRQIDSRRDLTAQYVGELQLAQERLQQQPGAGSVAALPIAPFRGTLAWPVAGRVSGYFGQADGRLAGSAGRDGMEIAAAEGTSVRVVHGGTVTFADSFTGFGTLVIVDHGSNNYSLYGYLSTLTVRRGDVVENGTELGRVGVAPAGQPALYFEMRVDGRSVDPLQWLQPR